ncbi:DUF3667 domain-containing protein [Permianibacter sp. IMCC34836]|uniref:DUF3667 domain-containing protein n=1 Tax=Permianibacter fluminis TaxID=2738515 RepID=UPI001555A98B|nr:DUF3667 domain-containing protein [Permianibacter fluminis]NQD38962.1 DUF3667 domain-containing protein [Permianibacter fluminis]
MESIPCPHCQQPVTGHYCAACGELRPEPLRPAHLLGPSLEQLGQLDGPIGRTVLALLRAPSQLITSYWRGERRHYSHPMKLVFWATTLFVAALTFSGLLASVTLVDQAALKWLPLVLALNNYLVFVYLLPVAWLGKYLLRDERNVTEAYVALLFATALTLLLKLIVLPLGFVFVDVTFWLHRFLGPAIYMWMLYPLLKGERFGRIVRGFGLHALYFAMSLLGNTGVVTLATMVERWHLS